MIDIISFLTDYSIPYATRGKNISRNWIGVNCPSCESDSGFHGAISPDGHFYNCWREGKLQLPDVVSLWLGVSKSESIKILNSYRSDFISNGVEKQVEHIKEMSLPGNSLNEFHKKYLDKRGFDPELLEQKYGFRGTAAGATYMGQDFSFSLIIPVFDRKGGLISFQSRDITGYSKIRYKGVKAENCIKHYKDTLYNLHLVKGDTCVLTEGIFDAIRGGDGFVCSFGTSLKSSQIRELSEFKNVFILFDSEDFAQEKALFYGKELSSLGVNVENIRLNLGDRDVGDLNEQEIFYLKKELNLK